MSYVSEKINPYGGNLSHRISLIDSNSSLIDITRLVVEFNIYESIFKSTLSADLVIRDAIGLIDAGQGPMTGQEFIEIAFESNNDSLLGASSNLLFKVNRVGNKTELTAGSAVYTINCSSLELEENLSSYVTTSYKDKTGSEIVKDIFKNNISLDNGKGLVVEECDNVVPYTATRHHPFDAIDIIGRESRSKEWQDASHFLFYETTRGFNFRTLSNLLSQEPLRENAAGTRNLSYYFSDPAAVDSFPVERTIIGHTFLDNVDTIDLLMRGMYDNNTGVIDPVRKAYSEVNFNYATDFAKLPHIIGGGNPTLNLSRSKVLGSDIAGPGHRRLLIGDVARQQSSNNITFDSRITANNDPFTFHGRERFRKSPLVTAQLASLRQYGINISVPVNLNVHAGDIIQIYIPGNKDRESAQDSAFINHYGSNPTFLVVAVATKLTADGDYISTMQCVKESFAVDLRGQKILGGLEEFTAGPLAYIVQLFSQYGLGTDNFIGIASGTLSSIIASGKDKALQAAKDAGTEAVDKLATDAAAEDAAGDGAEDAAADAVPLEDAIGDQVDATAAEIEANAKALADEAVQNLTNAAIATGTALVTTKVLSALNVSPAKLARLIQIIKILEKIPVFKGPITDVKADLAAARDTVTSSVQQAGDSVSSAITGGGE